MSEEIGVTRRDLVVGAAALANGGREHLHRRRPGLHPPPLETFLEGDTTMAECAFAVEQDAARLLGQAARAVA